MPDPAFSGSLDPNRPEKNNPKTPKYVNVTSFQNEPNAIRRMNDGKHL
jgi:hypothetical protein